MRVIAGDSTSCSAIKVSLEISTKNKCDIRACVGIVPVNSFAKSRIHVIAEANCDISLGIEPEN